VLEVTPASDGIEVTADIEPITFLADRGQLAQVLTNLVTNAYDAMGERGSLRVKASIERRAVVIEVQDDGPGIERALEERIFEPFYTDKHLGTGLGLPIARRLVEGHGGSVRLDLDAPSGSRFIVSLPYHQPLTMSSTKSLIEPDTESFAGAARGPEDRQGSRDSGARRVESEDVSMDANSPNR